MRSKAVSCSCDQKSSIIVWTDCPALSREAPIMAPKHFLNVLISFLPIILRMCVSQTGRGLGGRRLQPYRSAESQRLCPLIGREGFVISIDGGLPSDVVSCDFRGRRSRVQQIVGDAARPGRAVQRAQVSPCPSQNAAGRNLQLVRVNTLTKTRESGRVARPEVTWLSQEGKV